MRLNRFARYLVHSLLIFFLAGCQSSLIKNLPEAETEQQLYINAELNFAIEHPLNWAQESVPVSHPNFQSNTVYWIISDPSNKNHQTGRMLIQSFGAQKNLPDQLSLFLSQQPELQSGQVTEVKHLSGPALMLLGQDTDNGHLTQIIQGQQHNFIISLSYPKESFAKLLPIFQDVVASFTELIRPNGETE